MTAYRLAEVSLLVVLILGVVSAQQTAQQQQQQQNSASGASSSDGSLTGELVSLMQQEEKSLAFTQQKMAQEILESRRRLQQVAKHSNKLKDLPADVIRFRLEADRLESKRKHLMQEMQANADMLVKLNENEDIDGTSFRPRTVTTRKFRRPSNTDDTRAARRRSAQRRRSEEHEHEQEHEDDQGAPDADAGAEPEPALVQLYEDEIIDIDPAHERIYEASPRPPITASVSVPSLSASSAPSASSDSDSDDELRHNGRSIPLPKHISFSLGTSGFLDCSCQIRTSAAPVFPDSSPVCFAPAPAPHPREHHAEHREHREPQQSSEEQNQTRTNEPLPALADSVAEAHKVLGAADKSTPWIAGPLNGAVPPVMGLHCYEACQEHKCRRAFRREGFDAFHDCLLSCVKKCYHGDDAAMSLAEAAVHAQDQVNHKVKRDLEENTLH